MKATLDRWNAQCAARSDDDFGRPPGTMTAIRTPPFYFGEVWPIVSNTQGGPVHDARQRVLRPFGDPIPRLFEAGDPPNMHRLAMTRSLTEPGLEAMLRIAQENLEAGSAPEWHPYLGVRDCDATYDKAIRGGAQPLIAPVNVPGVGRLAMLAEIPDGP